MSEQISILIPACNHEKYVEGCVRSVLAQDLPNVKLLVVDDGSRRTDLHEFMLASDRLITDYSSCFFDFELMNRPVIHYAYDYRHYADIERGVEFELRDVCAGPVAETEEELLDCLSRTDEELLRGRGKDWRVPIAGETGHASADLAKWLGLVKGEAIS